jgi:hypothetical protein
MKDSQGQHDYCGNAVHFYTERFELHGSIASEKERKEGLGQGGGTCTPF